MTPGYVIPSPLGDIVLRVEDDWLTGLFFVGQKYFPQRISPMQIQGGTPPLVRQAQSQVNEFFSGERRVFTVPLGLRGTSFQRQVWKELAAIPYGTLTSYGEIAKRLGLATHHARAVGSAVGHNPVSVIVPCHRVVSMSGDLTGYAGGIDRKAALLALEKCSNVPASPRALR